jgi:hypothetical protein
MWKTTFLDEVFTKLSVEFPDMQMLSYLKALTWKWRFKPQADIASMVSGPRRFEWSWCLRPHNPTFKHASTIYLSKRQKRLT